MSDGQKLPYCGGITVIHTPGHICLYLPQSKILITGDEFTVTDGKSLGPVPHFTLDMDMAMNSMKKLTQYDIETVSCYHGGIYHENVNQRIAELVNK